jgi:hypothetical protein
MGSQVNLWFVLTYADQLRAKYNLQEFSPEFNAAYKNSIEQHVKWQKENKVKVGLWVVDEPVEQAPASCNRNYEQTMKYIKMVKSVPDAIAHLDPMGDSNFGVDHTGFADVLDILATHAYDGSKKMIEKCMSSKTCALWFYNCGRSRMGFGFNPWKAGCKGRWEWAYCSGISESSIGKYDSPVGYNGIHGCAYPSKNGVIVTPEYELSREGLDDYRYIYTLEQAIKNAGSKPEAKAEAEKAKQLLSGMKEKTPLYTSGKEEEKIIEKSKPELDGWRYKIAQEIIKLNKFK